MCLRLFFLLRLEFDLLRIRVPHRIKIWYCGHSFRSCACTCSLAEFLTPQSCNRSPAGLWLDKMRCTVGIEFWIPTGPTFWLTTLDCLDGVGGVPIQSIKSVAWSLHCQCLVLGTVSEVKTWWQNLWAFAGGNTSCTVCCFESIRFTFLLPFLSVLSRSIQWVCAELSLSSEKNCCTGSTFCKRAYKLSVEEILRPHLLLCGSSVTTANPGWRVTHWRGRTLCQG